MTGVGTSGAAGHDVVAGVQVLVVSVQNHRSEQAGRCSLSALCVCVCACACAGRCGALVIAQKAKRPTAGLGVCLLSGRMCLLLICVRSCPLCLSQERESVGGVSFFFLEAFCVKRLRVLLDG